MTGQKPATSDLALTVSGSAYQEAPDGFQPALARAWSTSQPVMCDCVSPGRRLVVRHIGSKYVLAVWPEDGPNHDFGCIWHRAGPSEVETGADPVTKGAQVQTDLAPPTRSGATLPEPTGDVGALTMPALLKLLWEEARLNAWSPGWTRDWWRVRREIYRVAEQQSVGGSGLDNFLFIPPPFRKDRIDEVDQQWGALFRDLRARVDGRVPHRLVLAEIREVEEVTDGFRLKLKHTMHAIRLSSSQRGRLFSKQPRAFAGLGKPEADGAHLLGLFRVSLPDGHEEMMLHEAVAMMTSRSYVPCDNGHELSVADRLVLEGRRFLRPMRTRGDVSELPDFILRDLRKPVAMEIMALDTLPYLERKLARIASRRALGDGEWVWRATHEPMPPFPSAASTTPEVSAGGPQVVKPTRARTQTPGAGR